MAYSDFEDPSATAGQLGLTLTNGDLFAEAFPASAPDWLSEMLDFHFSRRKRPFSEMYAREYLIAPLFSYIARRYQRLNFFSNEFPLTGQAPPEAEHALAGTPDYLAAYPKTPGAYDKASQFPLLAVAEAKKETFDAGWAQCAAELYACRQWNESAGTNGSVPLWGIVTNGLLWEFGRLDGRTLTLHPRALDADPLDKLLGALVRVFGDCLKNGEQMAGEGQAR